jgi:SAM-dependent methyltransferase
MFKKILSKIRIFLMRKLKPIEKYFLFAPQTRSVYPLSDKFGFDRGKPVDRQYIEKFLAANKEHIKGDCLEIDNNYYTKLFGGDRVSKSDVLDVLTTNKEANIYGDLRKLDNVADNAYDCLIITQTFCLIDDYMAAIRECHRILKPGGVILSTNSAISPIFDLENFYWTFSKNAYEYSFARVFGREKVKAGSYGNVLAGQAFWTGMAEQDLKPEELEFNDPKYPLIVTMAAVK